jgi:hypothetical protein
MGAMAKVWRLWHGFNLFGFGKLTDWDGVTSCGIVGLLWALLPFSSSM